MDTKQAGDLTGDCDIAAHRARATTIPARPAHCFAEPAWLLLLADDWADHPDTVRSGWLPVRPLSCFFRHPPQAMQPTTLTTHSVRVVSLDRLDTVC